MDNSPEEPRAFLVSLECDLKEDAIQPSTSDWLFNPAHWQGRALRRFARYGQVLYDIKYFREVLWSDNTGTDWLLLLQEIESEQSNIPFHEAYRSTCRYLSVEEAADWAMRYCANTIDELRPYLAKRTLTPTVARQLFSVGPRFDSEQRMLYVNGALIKTFKPSAKNVCAILATFQEDGWPPGIDDPLPGGHSDPGARLRDTVRSLNESQEALLFKADGTGEGIAWELRG